MTPETRIVFSALRWDLLVFIVTGVVIVAGALAWSTPRLTEPCPPSCVEARP